MNANPSADTLERNLFIEYLRSADSDELLRLCEQRTLEAFHRAAQRVPFYAKHLQKVGVDPTQVKAIEDFRRLAPILDKNITFLAHDIKDLCLDGHLDDARAILSSSGHSGTFSFGISTDKSIRDTILSIDTVLDYLFNVSGRRTLIVNGYQMGVHFYTSIAVVADTSVRSDVMVGIVKKFGKEFDQIILVGEGSFLKKVVEEGEAEGLDWKSLLVHVVVGGESIAENWRTYIAHHLGINLDDSSTGIILATMGVAELELNIFQETVEMVKLRRLAYQDEQLRSALFGEGVETCPMFFIYYPHRTYIEVLGNQQPGNIVISMLSPEMKIPLIRYSTGDLGRIYTRQQVGKILKQFGYSEDLLPEWKLPMIAVFGRGYHVVIQGEQVFPEEVREALYKDFSVAAAVTGQFKVSAIQNAALVEVQLKPELLPSDDITNHFKRALAENVKVPVTVQFYPFREYPHSVGVDYERKFVYVR